MKLSLWADFGIIFEDRITIYYIRRHSSFEQFITVKEIHDETG